MLTLTPAPMEQRTVENIGENATSIADRSRRFSRLVDRIEFPLRKFVSNRFVLATLAERVEEEAVQTRVDVMNGERTRVEQRAVRSMREKAVRNGAANERRIRRKSFQWKRKNVA